MSYLDDVKVWKILEYKNHAVYAEKKEYIINKKCNNLSNNLISIDQNLIKIN